MIRLVLVLALVLWTVPAHAALMFVTGTFTLTTGTTDFKVTDAACISPRVVIVIWTRNTANATAAATQAHGIGVAVDRATDQQGSSIIWNQDAASPNSSTRYQNTNFIRNFSTAGSAYTFDATIKTFDMDGFTLTRVLNDGTNLNIHHYICLGGSDLEDAYFGLIGITAGTGTKPIAGIGFQGNLALFFGGWTSATGTTSNGRIENFFGASNVTQNHSLYYYSQTGTSTLPTTSNAARSYMRNDRAIVVHDYGCCTGTSLAASVSAFTADGFDLNVTDNAFGSTRYVWGLILKGTFQSHIGTQARRSGTGTQSVAVSPAFTPTGVILAGNFATANATEILESHFSLGAGNASGARGIWSGDSSAISTDTNSYSSNANIYSQLTNPSTVASQAALSGLTSTGYDLNFAINDTAQRLFMHVVFGSAAVAASTRHRLAPLLFP